MSLNNYFKADYIFNEVCNKANLKVREQKRLLLVNYIKIQKT